MLALPLQVSLPFLTPEPFSSDKSFLWEYHESIISSRFLKSSDFIMPVFNTSLILSIFSFFFITFITFPSFKNALWTTSRASTTPAASYQPADGMKYDEGSISRRPEFLGVWSFWMTLVWRSAMKLTDHFSHLYGAPLVEEPRRGDHTINLLEQKQIVPLLRGHFLTFGIMQESLFASRYQMRLKDENSVFDKNEVGSWVVPRSLHVSRRWSFFNDKYKIVLVIDFFPLFLDFLWKRIICYSQLEWHFMIMTQQFLCSPMTALIILAILCMLIPSYRTLDDDSPLNHCMLIFSPREYSMLIRFLLINICLLFLYFQVMLMTPEHSWTSQWPSAACNLPSPVTSRHRTLHNS